MATDDGSKSVSLKSLSATGEEYNFFQVSRLLEGLSEQEGKPVRVTFAGHNSFALRPNFVESVDLEDKGESWDVKVRANGFHLFGHQSPIPAVYLEQLAREAQQGNDGATAFLDIFNNKILKELYELRRRFDPMLFNGKADEEDLFSLFESVSGILKGSEFERRMPKTFPRFWRKFSYQYANRRISYGTLRQLFSELLEIDVEIEPNTGGWNSLPNGKQASLNGTQALGKTCTLGNKYWSHSSCITLTLNCSSLEDYKKYLPASEDNTQVVALISVLTDLLFNVRLEFEVDTTKIPKCSFLNPIRLGFTSWLKSNDDALTNVDTPSFLLNRKDMLDALNKNEINA